MNRWETTLSFAKGASEVRYQRSSQKNLSISQASLAANTCRFEYVQYHDRTSHRALKIATDTSITDVSADYVA